MIKGIADFLDGYGVGQGNTFVFMGIVMIAVVVTVMDISLGRAAGFAVATSPVWLPLVLFFSFYDRWMIFVRKQNALSQGRVTLEILIPEEIMKSPEAMELVLIQLWLKATPDNVVQSYWEGKYPPTLALEIVSTGGSVHFYVNVPRKKVKNLIEAQLYAQYPGIEIRELPIDYTAEIPAHDDDWQVFSVHMGIKKNQAIPIKTYYDYKLDQFPKEEEKTDPLTVMIDALAALSPGERAWMQILITPHKAYGFAEGSLFKKPDWKKSVEDEIKDQLKKCRERSVSDTDETSTITQMTEGERKRISAMERSLSKYPFDTAVRIIYAGKGDSFLIGERLGSLIQSWFVYSDLAMNEFGVRWRTDFNYPWWQDPRGTRVKALKQTELEHYKMRFYDNHAQSDKKFVMTTEELATMWHLPGRVALTPTLGRIPSTRGEAPPNLPVG